MPYTRPYTGGFKDYPDTTTPINATALNTMDVGIKTANDQFQTVTTAQRTALSPTVGQAVWDSDLSQLMVYMNASGGNAWQPVGNRIVCASTTRPSTPFHGQVIYETDTKKEYTYNGTAWVQTNTASTTSGVTGVSNLIVPPALKVYRSTDLTSYSAGSDISWSAEEFDTDGMWSSGATVTIQTAGIYILSFYMYFNCTATATLVGPAIKVNGSNVAEMYLPVYIGIQSLGHVTVTRNMAVSDTVTCNVGVVGGSAYIIKGNSTESQLQSRFTATWIGRTS